MPPTVAAPRSPRSAPASGRSADPPEARQIIDEEYVAAQRDEERHGDRQ
jgi:hypothetical protein